MKVHGRYCVGREQADEQNEYWLRGVSKKAEVEQGRLGHWKEEVRGEKESSKMGAATD